MLILIAIGFLFLHDKMHSTISTPTIPSWKWRQQKCIEFSYINHNSKLDVYLMLATNKDDKFTRSTTWSLEPSNEWLSVSYGYFVPANTSYRV